MLLMVVLAAAACTENAPAPAFGVLVRETNAGLMIEVVRKNSPASKAELMRGDVLTRIGDTPMRQLSDYQAAVSRYRGQTVEVIVVRDAKELGKHVAIGGT
ncbi:MAG TPA: PDZ domain-containing protein [Burkholderiales bacterium]|nr:PDZ domain-containing protein [Burkholderiales bacterium]